MRAHSRDRVRLAIAVAIATTGCSSHEWIARFVPPATDQYARRFVLATTAGVLLAVVTLASYLPARRAVRIDPLVALQEL